MAIFFILVLSLLLIAFLLTRKRKPIQVEMEKRPQRNLEMLIRNKLREDRYEDTSSSGHKTGGGANGMNKNLF